MRLKLSALLLSTALATGLATGGMLLSTPFAPAATAQSAAQPGEVDVDALLKLIPAENATATYESKSYDQLSGITTVRKLKIADAKNPDRNYLAIEELGLSGVDIAAFQSIFDFKTYGAAPDATFKRLFGAVTVTNFSFVEDQKTKAAIERLSFGGFEMKQLAALPPGVNNTPRDDATGIKFLGALMDSVIAGRLEMTNLTIDGGGEGKMSVKGATLDGFNRGQLGGSTLDTFEMVMAPPAEGAPSSFFKIASASDAGSDFSKLIPWMLKAELPPVSPEPLIYIGGGVASGFDYDIMGTKVTIGEYRVDPISFFWLVPSQFKLTMSDMVMALPQGGEAAELKELGISQLDLDFGLDWAFDGNAGTAQLKELRIDESQLFNLSLALDLSGIDLAKLIDPAQSQGAILQLGLSFAQLVAKNNGGFDKFLTLAAKEENKTPDQLKQEALAQLTEIEGGMPGPDGQKKPLSERMKSIVAALKSFIQSPGTLTIKVQPATPINAMTGMGAMSDPMAAADALGITVEATP